MSMKKVVEKEKEEAGLPLFEDGVFNESLNINKIIYR